MTKLLLIDSSKIQEIQVGQEITIGRAYSNLLRLEGEEVSRVHAILYRRGAEYILRDLDSKNGLLLNGHKVVNCTVAPGDAVQLGKYHIVFEPPPTFDLAGYLRRNGINIPPDVVAAGRDMDTGSGLPPKDEESAGSDAPVSRPRKGPPRPDEISHASVNFRAQEDSPVPADESDSPLPDIFYTVAEISRMLDDIEAAPTPQFSADLIRLHRAMNELSTAPDSDDDSGFHRHILELAVTVLKADRGVIIFYDTGEILRLGAIVPRDRDVSVNRVVLKAALRERRAVLCNDAQEDPRFMATETVRKDRIGSLISYPLVRGDTVLGLIYCDKLDTPNAFRTEHLPLLRIAARLLHVGMGMGRASEAER